MTQEIRAEMSLICSMFVLPQSVSAPLSPFTASFAVLISEIRLLIIPERSSELLCASFVMKNDIRELPAAKIQTDITLYDMPDPY